MKPTAFSDMLVYIESFDRNTEAGMNSAHELSAELVANAPEHFVDLDGYTVEQTVELARKARRAGDMQELWRIGCYNRVRYWGRQISGRMG